MRMAKQLPEMHPTATHYDWDSYHDQDMGKYYGIMWSKDTGKPVHTTAAFRTTARTHRAIQAWLAKKGIEPPHPRPARAMRRTMDTEAQKPVKCHAGRDGDCTWRLCPQEAAGEPEATG